MIFSTPALFLSGRRWSFIGNSQGSVLIGVVITMVIVAGLGTALLNLNATSRVNQFGSMDGFRAFYLAESGGQYAIPIINKDIEDPDILLAMLDNHTFTFNNGDRFQLSLTYAEPVYTLLSTGILEQGARELNATRQITYRITKLGTQIDFPFDNKKDLKENFIFDGKKGKVKDKKKELDGLPAVELRGDDTYMRLNWGNPKADLPDLAAFWAANDELLSYDLQVKINVIEDVKKKGSAEFLIGLTFRDDGGDMYGMSFLKLDDCSDKDSLPDAFCSWGLSAETLYVVFWKNVDGNYSLIDSHKIESDNILDNTALNEWSTLVVHLEEEYILDAEGNRQDFDGDGYFDRRNLISGSLQGVDSYPRGTIDWDFSLYQDISWDSGASNPITESSLTTQTFGTDLPPEIGLHNFIDKDNVKKVYVDDFSIQLNSSSGSPSSVEQY